MITLLKKDYLLYLRKHIRFEFKYLQYLVLCIYRPRLRPLHQHISFTIVVKTVEIPR